MAQQLPKGIRTYCFDCDKEMRFNNVKELGEHITSHTQAFVPPHYHKFYFEIMFNGLVCSCGKLGINNNIHCDTDEGECRCGEIHHIGDLIQEGIIIKQQKKEKRKC